MRRSCVEGAVSKQDLFKSLMKKEATVVGTPRLAPNKVKIVSSWSNPGGSSLAHINLTNLLNANGYDCTFYGPHDWHLDKCKAGILKDCILSPQDTLISHCIQIPEQVDVRQHIMYCHEKEVFPLKGRNLAHYDLIVFVSNSQKEWHGSDHQSTVIPPIVRKVNWTNPNNGVAGVIGSIDENKQTHKSIQRAIMAGYQKVMLFGQVNDTPYFYDKVQPMLGTGAVVLADHEDDPTAMYGQVSEVFHSSLSETYGLVEAECRLSGIPFNGESNGQEILGNEEILKRWRKVLS